LRAALPLSKALHRAIIRQGSSIIDKQEIKPLKSYNVVVLSQGPDLPLFCHATVLQRLAYWLVDALRDRVGQKGRRGLPIVVACLDEQKDQFVVVGVTASFDFGEVRKKYVLSNPHSISSILSISLAANFHWHSTMLVPRVALRSLLKL
jgi:cell division control protein 45